MGGRSVHYCPCGTELHGDAVACGACPEHALPTWEQVRAHLAVTPGGPTDLRLRARYEHGQREHADDWTTWPDQRFLAEIQEEEDDIRIYTAMRLHARMLRQRREAS